MNTDKTASTIQPKEPNMPRKTLLTLPLLLTLASPALADADKALLAKCDMDRNGVINGPANDLPPAAWAMVEKERVCMREYKIDQLAKAMPDIRQRCDLNGNGRIDHPEPLTTPILMSGTETNARKAWRSLPEAARKQVDVEQKCVTDASIAQSRASIAQTDARIAKLDEDYVKMVQILAMLSPADAKTVLTKEIQRMEGQLAQEKNQTMVKSLEYKLGQLRSQLKALK